MLIILLDIVSIVLIAAAIGTIILTFKHKIKFFAGIMTTTGALLLSSIVSVYSVKLSSGIDVITATIDEFFIILTNTLNSLSSQQAQQLFGSLSVDDIHLLKNAYTVMFPAFLILNTLLISYVTYMIIKQILALFKKDVYMYPKFSQLKLRRSASVMIGVSYILPFFISNNAYSAAVSNIGIIVSGVASVCGLSLIDFKMRTKIKSAWFRLVIYISVFFITASGTGLIIFALVFMAIADSFLNFRRLYVQEVKKDGQ